MKGVHTHNGTITIDLEWNFIKTGWTSVCRWYFYGT